MVDGSPWYGGVLGIRLVAAAFYFIIFEYSYLLLMYGFRAIQAVRRLLDFFSSIFDFRFFESLYVNFWGLITTYFIDLGRSGRSREISVD